MFELRAYQTRIIDDTRSALRSHRSVLIQLPTGGGKTALAAFMIGRAAERGKRSWFVCHRDFLLTQTAGALDTVGVEYGFISAGKEWNPYRHVQIASIDTLRRRLDRLTPPDLIVWDEAHHTAAKSWDAVRGWAGDHCRHIGLTATPSRLDGKGLEACFDAIVCGPNPEWLISNGYLSEYKAFAPSAPDLTGIHTRHGDYAKDELAGVMDTSEIVGNIVGHYRELANNRRAIYYAVSVQHSQRMAAAFQAAGVPACHLDSTSGTADRLSAAEAFAAGRIRILTNVELFGEGFDLAAQAGREVSVEAVGLCRPTQSLTLHLQQIGRALRPKAEPAIILDHAGNLMRHGLPDEDRVWSLQGIDKKARSREQSPAVTQCKECFGVYAASAEACPYCGVVPEQTGGGREVVEVQATLTEIDKERIMVRKRLENRGARTYEDLVRLGVQRGYRSPEGWARHVWAARQARREQSPPVRDMLRASL